MSSATGSRAGEPRLARASAALSRPARAASRPAAARGSGARPPRARSSRRRGCAAGCRPEGSVVRARRGVAHDRRRQRHVGRGLDPRARRAGGRGRRRPPRARARSGSGSGSRPTEARGVRAPRCSSSMAASTRPGERPGRAEEAEEPGPRHLDDEPRGGDAVGHRAGDVGEAGAVHLAERAVAEPLRVERAGARPGATKVPAARRSGAGETSSPPRPRPIRPSSSRTTWAVERTSSSGAPDLGRGEGRAGVRPVASGSERREAS